MGQRRVIAVCGTPGVGKTTLAAKLAIKLNARLIDLKKYARENNLDSGYDNPRDTRIVDEKKLAEKIKDELAREKNDVVLEGLLCAYTPATHAIVLRCAPSELARRLKKRGYSKKKIMENLEAELLGVCLHDFDETANLLELDATDSADADEVIEWLRVGGRKTIDSNWFSEYEKILKDGLPK